MTTRVISPPREDWEFLPTRLTPGELQVAEFFDKYLPKGWEIYVQPHLNGLQSDFVLLHPEIGVAVYEVKDWNPRALPYGVEYSGDTPILKAQYPNARGATSLSGKLNPFLRVRDYKDYIHGICTAAIRGRPGSEHIGYGRITAGVIFTVGNSRSWKNLGEHFKRPKDRPQYYPIVGEDALRSGRVGWVFPEAVSPKHGLMTEQLADYLRGWLREPDFTRQQRQPLPIPDDVQRRLVERNPGSTGLRRMRGPAGSGKSLVLAARAVRLAYAGKRVLVVGFNITLSNYLRDLSVRRLRELSGNKAMYRAMVFTNFHEWQRYYKEEKFDAIMVDEGNDFSVQWWHEMHDALEDGGEMMLAFD